MRGLAASPDHLLIDGNRFVSAEDMPAHTCFVKGDAKVASIAAASILAKTHRDEFMLKAAETYPHYGWDTNMGYHGVTSHSAGKFWAHTLTPGFVFLGASNAVVI